MRNKRTLIILGVLVITAAAFIYRSLQNMNGPTDREGPGAFFMSQGNLAASFNQELTGQLKVLPEQLKVQVKINDSLVFEATNPPAIIPLKISIKGLPLGSYRLRVISKGSTGVNSEDERVLS